MGEDFLEASPQLSTLRSLHNLYYATYSPGAAGSDRSVTYKGKSAPARAQHVGKYPVGCGWTRKTFLERYE